MHLGPERRPPASFEVEAFLSFPSASAAACSSAELELLATLANLPLCQLITLIGLSACSKNVSLATPMM